MSDDTESRNSDYQRPERQSSTEPPQTRERRSNSRPPLERKPSPISQYRNDSISMIELTDALSTQKVKKCGSRAKSRRRNYSSSKKPSKVVCGSETKRVERSKFKRHDSRARFRGRPRQQMQERRRRRHRYCSSSIQYHTNDNQAL